MNRHNFKKGYAILESLKMEFGGPLSKPDNIFTAKLHKVPPYTIVYERQYGTGGWRTLCYLSEN